MKTKNTIIAISSIICLLPIILSIVIYNDLPEQIAIHWGTSGNPDTYAPKYIAAFGLPILLTAISIFSKAWLFNDPKRANTSRIMRVIIVWLIPVISLVLMPVMLFIAMGIMIPITMIVPLIVGIIFILCGNYLPKNRQNYSIGYKTPWTLNDADNWNKTHRIAGILWILGGIVLICQAFTAFENTFLAILSLIVVVILIVIPVFYSYILYKKST
jgi:Predicted integral membrane protein